ncbi:MAG: PA0069 family radical SAM protein [Bacteroidetes bacterium]|nr:PA0069 family radical SAM protein [Bacteroidota bacterium]
MINQQDSYLKGRGAQINTHNRFEKHENGIFHIEGIDEEAGFVSKTQYIPTHPKTFINKVDSPDVGLAYSMNPYQGCEHGCLYCYARNSHEYWGYSAGLDFEQKILVKQGIVAAMEKQLNQKKWEVLPIMLSGNTDCYQPIEKKMQLTRGILQTVLKYKHPVSLITKNSLILRDIDLLQELAKDNLVHVMVTVTCTDERVRLQLEPRTTTYKQRFKIIEELNKKNIPVGVMVAPIIPGITSHDVPNVIKTAAQNGAKRAGYTLVRLNGAIATVFKDWLEKTYPDRAQKVWNQIAACHGGQVNDSRAGTRMQGEGNIAEIIRNLFRVSVKKYIGENQSFRFNTQAFFNRHSAQIKLFDE